MVRGLYRRTVFLQLIIIVLALAREALRVLCLCVSPAVQVRAENVMLRRQLAMYVERGARPRRPLASDRIVLALAARLCAWRDALIVVKPATLIGWQRRLFRQLWRRKSRLPGRPPLARVLRVLIRRIARENAIWTAGRIGRELLTKFGLQVDEATVRKYMPRPTRGGSPRGDQSWSTFMRNHARSIVACDFAVTLTIRFQILYIFVAMEIGSRRILHVNATDHPTAEWTTQQLRAAIPADAGYRFLLHDRDAIFSRELDASVSRLGVRVLRSPVRSPKANAFCERLIGTMRRELLDWIIPLNEHQVRGVVREWATHYNCGRPHMALGPGLPEPSEGLPAARRQHRHDLPPNSVIVSRSVVGGLHHEYSLAA